MTDTIAHPPLPEPAAHILAADLRRFQTEEMCAQACSVAFSTPDDGRSEPLYTAQQMREYRDAPNWLPIETAPRDGTVIDLWRDGERLAGYGWCQLAPGNGFFVPADSGESVVRDATYWMPIPAAPIEQATGEKL